MELSQLDEVLDVWKSSLCKEVSVGGLISRNPTAHKWKAPYRAIVLRELTFWRVTDLLDQVSSLLKSQHYLGSLILIRCVLETLAVLIFLNEKILKVTTGQYDFDEFSKLTSRLMLGGRREDSPYAAINILSVLDRAEKKYPGLRKAYDDLSESAHPNCDGMGIGYSRIDRENYVTLFENLWHERFARAQLPLIELCLRIFESEYNDVWLEAMENFENWLVENDAELEAQRASKQ